MNLIKLKRLKTIVPSLMATLALSALSAITALTALPQAASAASADQTVTYSGTVVDACWFTTTTQTLSGAFNGQGKAINVAPYFQVQCSAAMPFAIAPATDTVTGTTSKGEAFTIKARSQDGTTYSTIASPSSFAGILGLNPVYLSMRIEGTGSDTGSGKRFRDSGTVSATYSFNLTF